MNKDLKIFPKILYQWDKNDKREVRGKITLIINQQMHYIKFHIKTLKNAPTCFDPMIILRELRCSLLKSF